VINSQEKERTRISAELHDGLGQVLSAARLNLAAMEGNAVEGPQLQKALGLIDRSCKELREISHDMMPSLLMKAGLVAAAKELIEGIKQGGKVDVGLDVELMEERLPADIELNLFRVLQELLTNIYKYAKATEVQIQIIREEKGITMMVEDNGVGFDPEHLKSSSGNGWYNIQSRVRLMGGEYEIDSRIDSGSVITVSVPL
jgi:signal transduction histidine kinase